MGWIITCLCPRRHFFSFLLPYWIQVQLHSHEFKGLTHTKKHQQSRLQIDLMLLPEVWSWLPNNYLDNQEDGVYMLGKIWPYKTAGLLSPACSPLPGDKPSSCRISIKGHFQVFITLQWHPGLQVPYCLLCCPVPCRRLTNTTYLSVSQVAKQGNLWAGKSS